MLGDAWTVIRENGASTASREALASETSHPDQAVVVYAARVARLAEAGGNAGYAEAASLVARMAGLRAAAEQAAYVEGLKTRFRRRRNFVRLLG